MCKGEQNDHFGPPVLFGLIKIWSNFRVNIQHSESFCSSREPGKIKAKLMNLVDLDNNMKKSSTNIHCAKKLPKKHYVLTRVVERVPL